MYGREQNHCEQIAGEEQSSEAEYRFDAIPDHELLLRRYVRTSERILDVENTMTLAGHLLHYLG